MWKFLAGLLLGMIIMAWGYMESIRSGDPITVDGVVYIAKPVGLDGDKDVD